MSGGSYNYEYCRVDEEYVGRMWDAEMDAMMKDLVKVLRAVEWYISCDTCEETYRETVTAFKAKWLRGDAKSVTERLTGIVNERLQNVRMELLTMIGVKMHGQYDGEEDAGAISP